MKFLSQLFEARGTDLTSKAFVTARRKLIAIYLLIIAMVILLFSGLVVMQVDQRDADKQLPPQSEIRLNTKEALAYAQAEKPNSKIVDTEYETKDGKLLYEVYFDDDDSVYIDVISGTVVQKNNDESDTLYHLLTDDIYEIVLWLGLIVFLIAAAGSVLVANATLKPIAVSAQKQKRFVSDAAHELRNPLAALQTTLESYIRSDSKKQFNETIAQELQAEVKRLISTSESLLSFEKVECNKQTADCSVAENLEQVMKRLGSQFEAKNIVLKKELAAQTLAINPNDLQTVLYNLLHNAVKFSGQGSHVTVKWNGKALSVADTGKGIDPKHLPHIFERFYKADQARTLDTEHSDGLGLALVSELITSYGWEIGVKSELDKGTTFTITF